MGSDLVQANRSERCKVRVACSTCAARKQRCDGQRPCSRCIGLKRDDSCQDRQISGGCHRSRRLKAPACAACSYSKVACSAVRPCPRCVRLGLGHSCVAPALPMRQYIPRMWAREVVPLAMNLPFPRSIRDFWMTFPDTLNKLVALELALSPERLDQLCVSIGWALHPDEVQNLRNRLDYSRILESVSRRSISGINMVHSNQDFATSSIATPQFRYSRNGQPTTSLTMNNAAVSLLGYSADIIKDAVTNGVHGFDRNPDFLPFIYKMFHPDSWVVLSKAFLNYYLFRPVCQKFYCQLARCDGLPIPVLLTFSAWSDKRRNFCATYSFTIADPPAVGTTLAVLAVENTEDLACEPSQISDTPVLHGPDSN